MTSESIFMKRVRGVLSDEESRWWRTYVLSTLTMAFCVVMAFSNVHSGHSYWCWMVPITYAGLWNGLHKCKQLLGLLSTDTSSPTLLNLSSEIHRLALSMNVTILAIWFFCVGRW